MKVLLINPPADNEIIANNPKIVETERGYNPPLGLLYIAGYLLQNSKHDVYVIDAQVDELSYNQLQAKVREIKPDVVGITAMTFTLLDVLETVKLVKRINADIKIVLGGPHVHIYPEETIQLHGVDFVVLGEGETTFAELLEVVDAPDKLKSVRGIVFKENGRIINTGLKPFIEDLDSLPHPARHLTNYKQYSSILAKRATPVTTMFTSRGCPFACTFCDRPHLGKTFRYRSAQNVVDEMEICVGMGIQEFLIYDDTFTVNRQRVFDICDEIIRRNLDVGWDVRAHVNTISEDMLDRMKNAGCTGIHYGVESGTARLLKLLNKGLQKQHVKEVFRWTKQRNIAALAYFMIGLPTEKKEDIHETFSFIRELDPDYLHLTLFTPFPATQLYKDGLAQGIIKRDYWREFAKEPGKDFIPPYWGEIFTKEELNKIITEGYKSFYLRPNYVLRSILKLNSFGEFQRKVRAGFEILKM